METAIVKLEGLTKKYDSKAVVDHVSLEIRQGFPSNSSNYPSNRLLTIQFMIPAQCQG